MEKGIPVITPELAKQMKDYLVQLYSDQMGIEYTYEEHDREEKETA